MGTGFDVNINPEEEGIVPRAVTQLFDGIDMRRKEAKQMNVSPPEFTVCVQFMEVKCKLYFIRPDTTFNFKFRETKLMNHLERVLGRNDSRLGFF